MAHAASTASWRRFYARRLAPLIGRAQPAARAALRELSVRTSPPSVVSLWIMGAWISQSISAVTRLDIPEHLKDGPKTCDELAAATGAHAPTLYRVMRALASIGLFEEDERGRFSTTRLGHCLEADAPDSQRDIALMVGAEWHWQPWGKLLDAVRTGEGAFKQAMGAEPYEYFAQHPADGALFSAQVDQYSRLAAQAATTYDFSDVRTVVDVGGGYGVVTTAILQANPGLRSVLFDLPDVVEGARARIAEAGLEERCTLVSGSFFEAVPSGGDVYVLSSILHNWDDERAQAILATCREAMAGSGRLLMVELVLEPGNTPSAGKLIDLQMLVLFSGGRERTAAEYRALLSRAGFRLTRLIPTPHAMSLIEAVCA